MRYHKTHQRATQGLTAEITEGLESSMKTPVRSCRTSHCSVGGSSQNKTQFMDTLSNVPVKMQVPKIDTMFKLPFVAWYYSCIKKQPGNITNEWHVRSLCHTPLWRVFTLILFSHVLSDVCMYSHTEAYLCVHINISLQGKCFFCILFLSNTMITRILIHAFPCLILVYKWTHWNISHNFPLPRA